MNHIKLFEEFAGDFFNSINKLFKKKPNDIIFFATKIDHQLHTYKVVDMQNIDKNDYVLFLNNTGWNDGAKLEILVSFDDNNKGSTSKILEYTVNGEKRNTNLYDLTYSIYSILDYVRYYK